jgi:DNA-directed RNA polymerase subunit RPC12/RpoP
MIERVMLIDKIIQPFIRLTGGILLAAALIRFIIAAGNSQVLLLPEPMLGISLRFALLIIGGIELTFAMICLFGSNIRLQAGLMAWLATCFVLFWLGILWMHCHLQGTCLGSLNDPLNLSRGAIGYVIRFLPICLLLGSYAALFHLWFAKNITETQTAQTVASRDSDPGVLVRFLKISCTACGGHIEFPSNLFGQKIPCPHCQATIALQKPGNIKMSCTDCDGHIEFPAHALGQQIPCPHCNNSIILKEPA